MKGAFLRECGAAYHRFPLRVSTRFDRGVGVGVSDMCCKRNLDIIEY